MCKGVHPVKTSRALLWGSCRLIEQPGGEPAAAFPKRREPVAGSPASSNARLPPDTREAGGGCQLCTLQASLH